MRKERPVALRLLLVGELDGEGEVACVWHWRPGMKAARPLRDRAELPDSLAGAEYSGASRQRITYWIEHRLAADRAATARRPVAVGR